MMHRATVPPTLALQLISQSVSRFVYAPMPPDVGFRMAMFVSSAVACATWERPPHPWTARQNAQSPATQAA
jgi:hypothetical protein